MKCKLNNNVLIIFLALLMLILIPSSFATDVNNDTVMNEDDIGDMSSELSVGNVQTGDIQTSVKNINYGGIIGVDDH